MFEHAFNLEVDRYSPAAAKEIFRRPKEGTRIREAGYKENRE